MVFGGYFITARTVGKEGTGKLCEPDYPLGV